MKDLWGIWPGIVESTKDPEKASRLQVRVPQVHGPATATEKIASSELPWAHPCVPFTGKAAGFSMIPEVGAGVWVMFVLGDPKEIVWLGGWYGKTDILAESVSGYGPDPKNYVIKTPKGNSISMEDGGSGKFNITAAGAMLVSVLLGLMFTVEAAITMSAFTAINIICTKVVLGQAASAQKLCNKAMMDLFNTHSHLYTTPVHAGPVLPTAPPTLPAVEGIHTTIHVTAS